MKISLIQPAIQKRDYTGDSRWQLTRPHSLHFLAASIKQKTNYEVEIIDFETKKYLGLSPEDILKKCNSQIFAITSVTYTRFEAIKIIQLIKRLYPTSLIIVGGVHFMNAIDDSLKNIPEIDIIVSGEGEIPLVEIAQAVEHNSGFKHIREISFREGGEIVHNGDSPFFENINNLPVFDDFEYQDYPEFVFDIPESIPAISIMSTRGCPNRCIFCSKSGSKYRLRDPQKVIDEIKKYQKDFNINGVNFLDLTFTANSNHVKALCQKIIEENLNIKWWCESRVNISLDLLDLMRKAGCVCIAIGVESGSPEILKSISKNITIDEVFNFCKRCDELGIRVTAMFIAFYPEETEEDLIKTFNFMSRLDKLKNITCAIQPMMIFPGTEIEKIARGNGILSESFSWSTPYEKPLNYKLGQLTNVPLYIHSDQLLVKYQELLQNRGMDLMVKSLLDNYTILDVIKKGPHFLIKNRKSPQVKYFFSLSYYIKFFRSFTEKMMKNLQTSKLE